MSSYVGQLALVRTGIRFGLAAVYLIAFLSAWRQFRPLLGENGLLPAPTYLRSVTFAEAPSLFHWRYSDRLLGVVCAVGMGLSIVAVRKPPTVSGAGPLLPLSLHDLARAADDRRLVAAQPRRRVRAAVACAVVSEARQEQGRRARGRGRSNQRATPMPCRRCGAGPPPHPTARTSRGRGPGGERRAALPRRASPCRGRDLCVRPGSGWR